jgi:hypothetical protein
MQLISKIQSEIKALAVLKFNPNLEAAIEILGGILWRLQYGML